MLHQSETVYFILAQFPWTCLVLFVFISHTDFVNLTKYKIAQVTVRLVLNYTPLLILGITSIFVIEACLRFETDADAKNQQ